MDYETPDGSQFSLREIFREPGPAAQDQPEFLYTTISAIVDGKAYFGRHDQHVDDVEEVDVLSALEPVPPQVTYPAFQDGFLKAPAFDPSKHYLKTPSFTWDDCRPGVTFVADCFLNEVTVLERLKEHCHRNVVGYHGCVVEDGRITHICLERCQSSISEYVERNRDNVDLSRLIRDVKAAIDFLHSLGVAHNDISPDNICVVDCRAVIVDFDSCMPFGQKLMKGRSDVQNSNGHPLSAAENDHRGLKTVERYFEGLLNPILSPS